MMLYLFVMVLSRSSCIRSVTRLRYSGPKKGRVADCGDSVAEGRGLLF